MTTANIKITKVLLGRGNTAISANYTGVMGEVTMDTTLKTLRVHDGNIAGGTRLATYQEVQDVATGNIDLSGYATTAEITAANANINSFKTYANATFSTVANAASQQTQINSINANVSAANAAITALQANAALQASLIDTLTSNAATQGGALNDLVANAATQAQSLTTLTANAATQANSLTDLIANAATQAQQIANVTGTYGNANVAAYLPTYTGNVRAGNINFNNGSRVQALNNNINLLANSNGAVELKSHGGNYIWGFDNYGFTILPETDPAYAPVANSSVLFAPTALAFKAGLTHLIFEDTGNLTVPGNMSVAGNILPSANVTYSLGDSTHQWRDLWVSNNTIYIGGTPVCVDGGTLLVNGAPVSGGAASSLVNGASTFQLFANGQSRSPDTIFAANGVSILDANGAIQGGIYNSGDADFFNIGASTGRGIKFYVNEEDPGPLFFANGSVNVPSNLYSAAGVIGDVSLYGGTISGTNPNWNNLTLASQIEGYSYIQLPTDATANVANLRIHNDIGNIEIATGDGVSYHYWYFRNDGDIDLPTNGDINFTGGGIGQIINEDFTIRVQDEEDDGWSVYQVVDDGAGTILGSTQLQRDAFRVQFAGGSQPQFRFADNGELQLPGNVRWDYPYINHNLYAVSDNNGDGSIELKTQSYSNDTLGTNIRASWTHASISTNNAQYSWVFDNSGNLTIPGNINYANGTSILSGIGGAVNGNIVVGDSQIQFVASSSGDGYGLSTIRLVPYTSGYDSAHIIIDPTYPNHIHIRAGGEQDNSPASLFLGGENSHFQIPAGANSSPYIKSNGYNWQFGTDGNLTIPGSINGANVISASTFVSNAFNVVTAGNLSITSQYGLGTTGTILEDNGTLELIAKGGGAVVAGWDSTYGNGLGNIATINFNEVGGEGIVLRTGNRAATEYNWNFDNTGNLTFPTGGSVTFDASAVSIIDGVTNINAVGTIGANVIQVLSDLTSFGASPAPVIYGFSSISTTGSAANEGNISASGNLVASQNAYVTGNVFAAGYNFANGVNILDTITGVTSISSVVNTSIWSDASGDYQYGTLDYSYAVNGNNGQFAIQYSFPLVYGNVDVNVGNVIASNVTTTNGIFWANGQAYSTGGGSYGNTEVAAYLPSYAGNLAASRAQVTNAVDFMYGGYPYMGWQLSGSDTLKLRTNIASGDYTNDAIIVDRQSLAVNVVATLTTGNIITTSGLFWANGTAYATSGSSYGNIEVGAYLLTGINSSLGTLVATNFSTANARITGGSVTGGTGAFTTLQVSNFTSGNVFITGAGGIGYAQNNAVSRIGNVYSTYANFTNFSTANAVITGGSATGVTGAATTWTATNFSSANVVITGGYLEGLANVTATGNVTAGNLIGYGSNTTITAGTYTSTFDNVGMVTVPNLTVSGSVDATSITTDSLTINDTGWTNFTPTWYANVTANSMGDGLAEGRYRQLGKTVEVWIQITMGSTTTFGTGEYKVSLPVASRMLGSAVLSLVMIDSGTRLYNSLAHNAYTTTIIHTNSNVTLFWDTGVVTNTAPFTWTSGDSFVIAGTYEAE